MPTKMAVIFYKATTGYIHESIVPSLATYDESLCYLQNASQVELIVYFI